jgi:hydroxyethylthiazole kinase-like sugar kinase family protein
MNDLLRDPDVALVSGYARLPGGVTSQSQYEQLGVVLAVNIATGMIVAADSTLLTQLARDFFRALVEGLSVYDDAAEIVARTQRRYAGQSGQALIAALRRCMESCVKLREEWH